jgi:hypothetical protein
MRLPEFVIHICFRRAGVVETSEELHPERSHQVPERHH